MIEEFVEPALTSIIFVSYEGAIDDESGCYHGLGSATLDNGCKYEGNFVNGMMHGSGKFTWPNGVEYEGELVYGKVSVII